MKRCKTNEGSENAKRQNSDKAMRQAKITYFFQGKTPEASVFVRALFMTPNERICQIRSGRGPVGVNSTTLQARFPWRGELNPISQSRLLPFCQAYPTRLAR